MLAKEKERHLVTLNPISIINEENYCFGRSPIKLQELWEDKASKKRARYLEETLGEAVPISIGNNSIIHTMNGRRFIEITLPVEAEERTFFVEPQKGCPKIENLIGGESESLRIVSGICLFGASGATGIDRTDKRYSLVDPVASNRISQPIVRIEADKQIHPYEAETVKRLTLFINSLNHNRSVNVDFHLPIPEYILYGITLAQKAILPRELFTAYCKAVLERGKTIASMITKRLNPGITIEMSSPLDPLLTIFVNDPEKIELEEARIMLQNSNELWKQLDMITQPQSWTDLSYISYTLKYLKAENQATSRGVAAVAVENPEEFPILKRSRESLQSIQGRGLQMLALYVHPYVLTASGFYGKNFIFYHQPGESRLTELKAIASVYK